MFIPIAQTNQTMKLGELHNGHLWKTLSKSHLTCFYSSVKWFYLLVVYIYKLKGNPIHMLYTNIKTYKNMIENIEKETWSNGNVLIFSTYLDHLSVLSSDGFGIYCKNGAYYMLLSCGPNLYLVLGKHLLFNHSLMSDSLRTPWTAEMPTSC